MRAHEGIGTAQSHLTVSTAPMTISVSFHEPVRWDGWLLYTHESTQVGAGMSYVRGAVHTEEGELIPHLRGAKVFPAPASAAEAALYAEGFAWAMHGIAPDVLARVEVMLPAVLLERIPAARTAFAARCERVWGTAVAGAARTPIPDPPV